MTTKTTGAEFKLFYSDNTFWPQDNGNTYHDDETILVNGGTHNEKYENIPDDALVTVDGGIMFGPQWDGNEPSFDDYFKRWRKLQSTVSIVVRIEHSKEESLRLAIKAAGGKIVK